jgi:hypothetical protein
MELAEKGLYRAAFASALYAKKPERMKTFIDFFNKKNPGTAVHRACPALEAVRASTSMEFPR